MQWFNSKEYYGWVSIILHWISALFILVLFPMGVYMVMLTYYDPWYHTLPEWHKALGVGLILLTAIRTLGYVLQPAPRAVVAHAWEKPAAKVAHIGMLILLWGCLAAGYLIIAADDNAYTWMGVKLPLVSLPVKNQADVAGWWHEMLAYGLIALVALHALAALKHHFMDRLPTLKRMLRSSR